MLPVLLTNSRDLQRVDCGRARKIKSHMKRFALSLVLVWLGRALAANAAEELLLNSHLEPLRPFLEKTWKGTFNNSKPDKPTIDVKKWERALNGETARCLHSVSDGAYGGESLLF